MWLLVIICILFGAVLALVIQAYCLYLFFLKLPELKPESKPRRSSDTKLPEELLKIINDGAWKERKESCVSLNLIFQFLFNEWKDTKKLRRWLINKLNGEFLEMQRSRTGRLLENITIRDLQLGSDLPILKNICICDIMLDESRKTMQELTLAMEMEYGGGFELAVDVDMVLGRSASVAVRISKLQGKVRLEFMRNPFSHWSFSFIEEPQIEFAVSSQFQGRQLPQVTSLIIHQIRRAIRKKHTLPNYKIRFHPFLPTPQVNCAEAEPLSIESTLEIVVVKCSRLCSMPQPSVIYCTLELDETPWAQSATAKGTWHKQILEMNYKEGQNLGLVLKQEFVPEKMENCILVKSVSSNSCAFSAGLKKNDSLVSIGDIKVTHIKQAMKILTPSESKIILHVKRKMNSKGDITQYNDGETSSAKTSPRKNILKETATVNIGLNKPLQESNAEGELNLGKVKKSSSVKASKDPRWNESFCFQLSPNDCYINVGVWCSSEQADVTPRHRAAAMSYDNINILLGKVSISLVSVVEDCAFTSLGTHSQNFQLLPPNSLLDRQWVGLSKHRGFDHRLCCGDIYLEFRHQDDNFSRKNSRELLTELDEEPLDLGPGDRDDIVRHDFVSTQFASGTICHFCRKKIWLKVAYKCCNCAMICHKKCVQKCRLKMSCPHEGISVEIPVPQAGFQVEAENLPQLSATSNHSLPQMHGSSQSSKRNLQAFLSNITSQRRSSLARAGSTQNLAPPSSTLMPISRSLPPSPHHSPAQSRKCSLQEVLFPWLDPSASDEQEVEVILEQLLMFPHDDALLALVKDRGKDLYYKLSFEERKAKLNIMITKIKESMDMESAKTAELSTQDKSASPVTKTKMAFLVAKCHERMQALETLMLLYISGLQHCMDMESQMEAAIPCSNIRVTAPSPSLEKMLQEPLLTLQDQDTNNFEDSLEMDSLIQAPTDDESIT